MYQWINYNRSFFPSAESMSLLHEKRVQAITLHILWTKFLDILAKNNTFAKKVKQRKQIIKNQKIKLFRWTINVK